jgi:mRNA interferase RelE/StbE
MADYRITFARSARKELEKLDVPTVNAIFPKIERLGGTPRPKGARKLHGEQNLWRIRVGDYRVIYTIDDEAHLVDVVAVRHRSEAYR